MRYHHLKTGTTFWFTGPPGSGKSHHAKDRRHELQNHDHIVVHLDGDMIRAGMNSDLGFSREDRLTNLERVGYLCKILNDQGIDVVASFVSPYEMIRIWLRHIIPNFRLIYVCTPPKVCYERRKDLYDNADVGRYEVPKKPDEIISGTQ